MLFPMSGREGRKIAHAVASPALVGQVLNENDAARDKYALRFRGVGNIDFDVCADGVVVATLETQSAARDVSAKGNIATKLRRANARCKCNTSTNAFAAVGFKDGRS